MLAILVIGEMRYPPPTGNRINHARQFDTANARRMTSASQPPRMSSDVSLYPHTTHGDVCHRRIGEKHQ